MKINRLTLRNSESKIFEEDIDFTGFEFDQYHIRNVPECHVVATATDAGETLIVDVKIKTKVIAACAYTLEDVELKYNIKDVLYFSDNEEDSESCFYEPNPIIDLDPYILGIIFSEVPVKVVKKGAKLPDSGKGYRVITEDELLKEKSERVDPRWAALDSIVLDDEENK